MTHPTTMLDWVTFFFEILGIIGIVVGAISGIYKLGFNNATKKIRRTNLVMEYQKIYAPIYGLFLTMHLSSSRSILYPYFFQRFSNSKPFIKSGKHWSAFLALFNKGKTREIAGFEYGDVFPTSEIIGIVKGNEPIAEKRLLTLISSAHESRMEDLHADETILTDEEFELFKFIMKRYSDLYRLFGPK